MEFECHVFDTISALTEALMQSFKARTARMEIQNSTFHCEPVWIDIQNPSLQDINILKEYFQLHPLTVEHLLVQESDKWTFFDHYMYMVLLGNNMPGASNENGEDEDELLLQPLKILLFKNFVVTIHTRPIPSLEMVLKRLEAE